MNKTMLSGRLTKDPDVRATAGQNPMAVCNFNLAVDRKYKRQGDPEADFFNCTAFGKQAEFMEKYLMKGSRVMIAGRIQNDSYTNREGQKVTVTKIMVEEIEFADSAKKQKEPAPVQDPDFLSINEVNDEELPFNF